MARTMDTGLIAALNTVGYTPIVAVQLGIGSGDTWTIGYLNLAFVTQPVAHSYANGLKVEDRLVIEDVGAIFQGFDEEDVGGLAKPVTFSFKLINMDGYHNWLYDRGIRLEGRSVYAYLDWTANTVESKAYLMFKGVITDVEANSDYIECKCESDDRAINQKIPMRKWEADDSGVWTLDQLPQGVIGKPIPLVFGDCDLCLGWTIADVYDTGSSDKGRVVQFVDIGYDAAATGISAIEELAYGDSGLEEATESGIAWIDGASGRTIWTANTAKGIVYFDDKKPLKLYLKALIIMKSWTNHYSSNNGVLNEKNALNGDGTDYTYVPGATDYVTDRQRFVSYKIPRIGISGTIINRGGGSNPEIYFVGKITPENTANWTAGWSAGDKPVCWGPYVDNTDSFNGFGQYTPAYPLATTATIDNWDTMADWEDYPLSQVDSFGAPTWDYYNDLSDYSRGYFGAGTMTADLTSKNAGYIHVYRAALYIKFHIDFPASGFIARVKGHIDNASGHFTGTASALMDEPIHVLGYMLSVFLNAHYFSSAVVSQFSTAFSWKCARQFIDEEAATEAVDQLCREFALCLFWDPSLSYPYLFYNGPRQTWESVTTIADSDVIGNSVVKFWRTPVSDLVTSFVFRYHWNPAIGDYDRMLYCKPSDSSAGIGAAYEALCSDAEDETGGNAREETFEFDWIRDDATMDGVAKRYIEAKASRKGRVVVDVMLYLARLQVGDVVKFSSTGDIRDSIPNDFALSEFRIMKKEVRPADYKVRLTLRAL